MDWMDSGGEGEEGFMCGLQSHIWLHHSVTPWHGYTVCCGVPKSNTVPKPMWPMVNLSFSSPNNSKYLDNSLLGTYMDLWQHFFPQYHTNDVSPTFFTYKISLPTCRFKLVYHRFWKWWGKWGLRTYFFADHYRLQWSFDDNKPISWLLLLCCFLILNEFLWLLLMYKTWKNKYVIDLKILLEHIVMYIYVTL